MEQRQVLITGISSGIGNTFCKLCLENNFHVTGVVRRESQRELFSSQLGKNLDILQADLSQSQDVANLSNEIKSKPFNYIVLNAGCAQTGLFHEQSLESMQETMEANLLSNMRLVHALLPKALETKTKFVFISSISARLPAYNFASYATSKAGLSHFCNSLRRENPSLSFLCVEIGPVNTPMHKKANNTSADTEKFISPELIAQRLYQAMLKREGVVTLSWKWWLMRKIAMCADELLTRLVVKR